MPLGIYVSVPFCRTKCSYCNFASGVFGQARIAQYVQRVCADIRRAEQTAMEMGGVFARPADSIYLGGGTPTLLEPAQLEQIFAALRETFTMAATSEITVECAPGTVTPMMLDALLNCGVNRVSLGVQSFVDEEARAVGRLHTCATAVDDIRRLLAAGITNLNLDLIAGLPHQTRESWRRSLQQAIETGAPHLSIYMLEVDEDSRLGREVLAGGTRYHAHFVPDEDLTAALYENACEALEGAGVSQYEISNFARPGWESRHNLKYWRREPYWGFGVDAHAFLATPSPAVATPANGPARSAIRHNAGVTRFVQAATAETASEAKAEDAVRFATSDSLDLYLAGAALARTPVSRQQAREESFFLGLRLTQGVELKELERRYGLPASTARTIAECCEAGLMEHDEDGRIRLNSRGRLLSNEVFAKFLA